jgi:hypothetical protein
MAVELVAGTFDDRVGETFGAAPTHSGEPLDLVLRSCDESPHARADQPAFSLTFHGPGERREQQIFKLDHAELGEFELFLVPIAQLEGGIAYEAVIN